MIITKEQQEAWIDAYMEQKHTPDECVGFIDGIEKAMSVIKNITNIRGDVADNLRLYFERELSDIDQQIRQNKYEMATLVNRQTILKRSRAKLDQIRRSLT